MSRMYGADVDALDRLAARLDTTATAVALVRRTLEVSLFAAPWAGGASEVFRRRWGAEYARSLAEAASFLRGAATTLRHQAAEQRAASEGAGGLTGGPSNRGVPSVDVAIARLQEARTPAEVAAVWASLTDEQRRILIQEHPDLIGNLDGVPPRARVEANAIRIDRDLAEVNRQLEADPGSRELQRRREILERLSTVDEGVDDRTGEIWGRPQVYLYDPEREGRVAVIEGDLDKATHVAFYVPGTGASLDNAGGDLDRARNLYLASTSDSAVITWIGYDAPRDVFPNQNGPSPDYLGDNAMLEKFSDRGGRQLADSIAGLGRPPSDTISVLGHSYAATVAAKGAHLSGQVDNLVLFGAPGSGFDFASQIGATRVFSIADPRDPTAQVPIFGNTPDDPSYGAVRLDPFEPGNRPAPAVSMASHSDYMNRGTGSVNQMAAVVDGRYGDLRVLRPTTGEVISDVASMPFDASSRLIDVGQDAVPLPQWLDDKIDNRQGVANAVRGAGQWAVGAGIDEGLEAFKRPTTWLLP
jgi:hypothetical protein